MIPQKNDKKRIDNGVEHPFPVLTAAFVFFVGVADVVERFHIVACGEEQERMRLGIVQRPHEKIGQNIIFRERAEKCGFKRTDPQNDIEDHVVIRKRTDSVWCVRRDDADVAGFHLDFLFQNVVGAASLHHADDFQKCMFVPGARKIAEVLINFAVQIFVEKRIFVQRCGEQTRERIRCGLTGFQKNVPAGCDFVRKIQLT